MTENEEYKNVFEALQSIMEETVTVWGFDDEDDRCPIEHNVFAYVDDERIKTLWLFIKIVKRYFELKSKGITTEAEALEHRELLNKINEIVGIEK